MKTYASLCKQYRNIGLWLETFTIHPITHWDTTSFRRRFSVEIWLRRRSAKYRHCFDVALTTLYPRQRYLLTLLRRWMDVDSVPSNFVSLKLTLSGRHLIDVRDRRCFDVVSTSIVYRQISGVHIIAGIATIAQKNSEIRTIVWKPCAQRSQRSLRYISSISAIVAIAIIAMLRSLSARFPYNRSDRWIPFEL